MTGASPFIFENLGVKGVKTAENDHREIAMTGRKLSEALKVLGSFPSLLPLGNYTGHLADRDSLNFFLAASRWQTQRLPNFFSAAFLADSPAPIYCFAASFWA